MPNKPNFKVARCAKQSQFGGAEWDIWGAGRVVGSAGHDKCGGIASRNRVAPPVARGRGIVLQRALRRVYLADGREVAPPGRGLPRTIRKTPRVSERTRQCLKKTPTCWTWPCPTP